MWLTPNSKDFLDVSKRTIVAKVKLFFYHRHTFQLDSCYGKERTCVNPLSLVLRSALAVEEVLVFFELELIVTFMSLYSVVFDDDSLSCHYFVKFGWIRLASRY